MGQNEIFKFLENSVNTKVVESLSGGNMGNFWTIRFEDGSAFYIECSWRIEKDNKVLASHFGEEALTTGHIARSVKQLEDKFLRAFELVEFYDLSLFFDDGYHVSLFCDISYFGTENGESWDTNWEYNCKPLDQTLRVTNLFDIVWEK